VNVAPRLEINLGKIQHNASELVRCFARQGISITGVCKATLGSAAIATTLLRAGVTSLADSHIETIESMRRAGVQAEMMLIRSPMLSQVARVVASADVSLNTEIEVIRQLSQAAVKANRSHAVILMVELGDRREGIMPEMLLKTIQQTLCLPNIMLKGIGTNLACQNGVVPDIRNMSEWSALATLVEGRFGCKLETVSGGNSANLDWALSAVTVGRINHLRLGESILLGREPLHRRPLDGLFTDAFTVVAEVIESKRKPSLPAGVVELTARGVAATVVDRGVVWQSILAVGHQDVDPEGLLAPKGIEVMGASSDHLIVVSDRHELSVGAEVRFEPDYGSLVRAMTSPFVSKVFKHDPLPMGRLSKARPMSSTRGTTIRLLQWRSLDAHSTKGTKHLSQPVSYTR